jgi:exodeoxyribonuclease V alpha subunit
MKTQPHPSDREVLAGLVERVTYQNAENGFCVIRVKARSHRELVTVVGHAATIAAGEWITASGDWVNDRTHGQQFRARFLKTSEPTSVEGIEKYLASGMIRGIGPTYAKKLLRAFGEKVFEVIETQADRLREVGGIGPVRAARIVAAWAEQKAVREIMVFLHSHGVGTARAVRIFKTYGADAIQVMTENPYRLARDIRGISKFALNSAEDESPIEKAKGGSPCRNSSLLRISGCRNGSPRRRGISPPKASITSSALAGCTAGPRRVPTRPLVSACWYTSASPRSRPFNVGAFRISLRELLADRHLFGGRSTYRFVSPIIHRAIRALHCRFCHLVQIEGRIDQRDMR